MSTPFLGSLMLVSFNFAPKGFALCNGQVLPINQNQALFSLLGTTYGGNGIQTFALPNLQGRVALHFGNGFTQGDVSGSESVTLNVSQIPQHNHTLTVSSSNSVAPGFAGMTVGMTGSPAYSTSGNGTMAGAALTSVGGAQAHENRSPYVVMNWVIALTGIFPSRS